MDRNDFRKYITIVESQDSVYKIKMPMALNAASPVLSKENLDLHYNTLYKNYVDNSHKGIGGDFSIAGAQLHTLFFEQLCAVSDSSAPSGAILKLINEKFGKFSDFKKAFKEEALSIHGSGWCYLNKAGKIKVIENHEVRSDVAVIVDMWEHSYIIDYKADKSKYLDNIWKIIDWRIVNARLG